MPKFNVVVGYRRYDTVEIEVEAEDQEAAEEEACRRAQEEIPLEQFELADDEWFVTDCDEVDESGMPIEQRQGSPGYDHAAGYPD